MKKLFFLLILICTDLSAKSQSGTACLRTSDGLYYTPKNIFGYYEILGAKYSNNSSVCPRVSVGTKTGSKCQFFAGGTLYDEYNIVLLTANGPVQCDLDHYGYGALAIAGLFAVRRLRKIMP